MKKWVWDKTEARRPGTSGDLAKLFRHEEPKSPGIFAVDAPPPAATLLAREVIQNSWDAARELAEEVDSDFALEFRFLELVGGAKRDLVSALDLEALSLRASRLDRRKIGLRQEDCLDDIDDDDVPLRILKITEHGTTGMYGPWDQMKSHMYLALVSLGYTVKLSGAGGSYGYGKAGLISGSKERTVVAYSCFRPRHDEPGITRRLLGMTYWGQHDIDDDNYTGFGSFSSAQDGIDPFTNEDADWVARSLDLATREASDTDQLGTTFLLIDPSVEPVDLVRAIERSWWPAIEEGDFTIQVVDYEGLTHHPRPRQDEVLRTFIEAWELARGKRQPRPEEYYSPALTEADGGGTVGTLGIVADLSGWSFADHGAGVGDDEVKHRSLVALTRGPRMVVEYLDVGRTQPYLRGAYIADESIDDILRSTEPKAHDAWRTESIDGEVDPRAAATAKHVITRIKQAIANHRNRIKPPVPPPEEVNLPLFNEIMRRVMTGMGAGVPQPLPETRPISIRLEHRPVAVDADRVKIEGSAVFSLTDHFEDGDRAKVKLTVIYRFLEDDRVGEAADLEFSEYEGLESSGGGTFLGELDREEEVRIRFESHPYDSSWSGRLIVNGEIVASLPGEEKVR